MSVDRIRELVEGRVERLRGTAAEQGPHGGFVLEQTVQVDREHGAPDPAKAAGNRLPKRRDRLEAPWRIS